MRPISSTSKHEGERFESSPNNKKDFLKFINSSFENKIQNNWKTLKTTDKPSRNIIKNLLPNSQTDKYTKKEFNFLDNKTFDKGPIAPKTKVKYEDMIRFLVKKTNKSSSRQRQGKAKKISNQPK